MERDINTCRRMFEHVCAFVDCAQSCEIEPNNIELRTRSHTVAGIVNSAFSCEIFIKTLLVYNGKDFHDVHGHELKGLWEDYKALDERTAADIEERIKEYFQSSDENIFDNLLAESSDAFEYWRYIYEKDCGNVNINFLIGLRYLLRGVCCYQLFGKTWEEYKAST